MATERRATKRINRHRAMKIYAYIILMMLVIVGLVIGLFIGRKTAPVKVETVTVTEQVEVPVEVPVCEEDKLPETEKVTYYNVPLSHSLQNYIYEVCADEGIPTSLVIAMIDYESNFNPEMVSDTDDYGLMQINKINHDQLAEDYQCADMLNSYQNIFCGVKVLGSYLKKYDNDYAKALMAYNMGEYGAKKAWTNGITSTTYSEQILELMSSYEQEVRYDKQENRQ